jgi:hypothetical protein
VAGVVNVVTRSNVEGVTANIQYGFAEGTLQVGSSVLYTGPTLDTNFLSNTGAPWQVASLATINVYGPCESGPACVICSTATLRSSQTASTGRSTTPSAAICTSIWGPHSRGPEATTLND